MRRLRVDRVPAQGETQALDAPAAHYLVHVLRQREGARLVVFDGSGTEADAVLVDPGPPARIEGASPPRSVTPVGSLHLVLGIPKGPALERSLRMATEAGATHIHLVRAARSVRANDKVQRWQRILEAAAGQCGRADVPHLEPITPLAHRLQAGAWPDDRRVALPGAPAMRHATGDAVVAVGPEGGFTAGEVELLADHGFAPMGLARFVLRTDTAVAAALTATSPLP